jgi:hypothetical protein
MEDSSYLVAYQSVASKINYFKDKYAYIREVTIMKHGYPNFTGNQNNLPPQHKKAFFLLIQNKN